MSEQAGGEGTEGSDRHERRVADLEEALKASEGREKALQKRAARIQSILDEGENGGWDWDFVTGEVYLSPSWYRVLGYNPPQGDASFDAWERMIPPEDAARVKAAVDAHLEGRTPTYDMEHRVMHASGRAIWVQSRGRVVARDDEGRPTRLVGTLTDVTRRREAEEERRHSQALLAALLENSTTLIYVRDLDFKYVLANKRLASFMGREVDEILGKADYEFIPPSVIEEFRVADRVVLETGKPFTTEEFAEEGHGQRVYLSIKFPVHDEHGKMTAIGGISSDITDVKRAERERAELQERIIAAQRDALRELTTPLIPIADDVVVMPLIGTIDSQRAQQLMDTVLSGVAAHRAATVILDVTGVAVVDTHVANALVRASRAVKLLGAEVVLTGIRPDVARTLASIGADLGDIVVHGTLRGGIGYAMRFHETVRQRR